MIPHACCFQLCVKLHKSTTISLLVMLVYTLHDSLTTRVQLTSSLNALTLASIALPLLTLSFVSQTRTFDNAQ